MERRSYLEVIDEIRVIGNDAEQRINKALKAAPLSPAWRDWEWCFISIVISPALGVMYPERVRRNMKDSVLEFRLAINFSDFLGGDRRVRIALWFDQVERSVDLMSKWRMSVGDRACLKVILHEVRAAMLREVQGT